MPTGMGGRKFRLGRHRKNEELKRRERKEKELETTPLVLTVSIPRQSLVVPSLTVSLPLTSYLDSHVTALVDLHSRLSQHRLPSSWTLTSRSPLTLCKLRVQLAEQGSCVDVIAVITIKSDFEWTLSFMNHQLTPTMCPVLSQVPSKIASISSVHSMISLLESVKVCTGNTETRFIELWQHRSLTLHGSLGKYCSQSIGACAYDDMSLVSGPLSGQLDDISARGVSILRHTDCQSLLPDASRAT